MTIDAYAAVKKRLLLNRPLPTAPGWSAAPDFINLIVDHCRERRPLNILECSSSLTTLALARSCQMNNYGHVFSLAHELESVTSTRAVLDAFRVGEYATVVHAPLEPVTLLGLQYRWYCLRELHAEAIDMVVIDGPPGQLHDHARYPALPLLDGRLADACTLFLNDAATGDARETVEMWKRDVPGIKCEYVDLERGCFVLSQAH